MNRLAVALTLAGWVVPIALNTIFTLWWSSRVRQQGYECGYQAGFNAGLLGSEMEKSHNE